MSKKPMRKSETMVEVLRLERNGTSRIGFSPLTAFVKRVAARMLDWEPKGSVLVELPNGERFRFGALAQESGIAEPLLRLKNYRVITKAMRGGTLGFAKAYIDGDIECTELADLFRFFSRNREEFARTGRRVFKARFVDRLAHLARRNSLTGSRRNIAEHYDLGNDFFKLWLDGDLNYSSGLYAAGVRTLADAQKAKTDRILELLDLSGGESLLEIGCGWGAFARRAAAEYMLDVTGLTLSREQRAHAQDQATLRRLDNHCDFRLQDYREATGSYDRIVSIEMIEAVGEDYWPGYFKVLADRLKPSGCAVIQAITIHEVHFERYRRSTDFIQRFVFPGGMLPTPGIITSQAEMAGLHVDHAERFGLSYAKTLREWSNRFEAAWPKIAELGFDERFRRRWRYYLAFCEAGFREGLIDVGLYRLRKG